MFDSINFIWYSLTLHSIESTYTSNSGGKSPFFFFLKIRCGLMHLFCTLMSEVCELRSCFIFHFLGIIFLPRMLNLLFASSSISILMSSSKAL